MPEAPPICYFRKLVDLNLKNYDYDCIYPLAHHLGKIMGWDKKQLMTYCFLYMAYYNESSALVAFEQLGYEPIQPGVTLPKLPIDTARRALRGGTRLHDHWTSLASKLPKELPDSWEGITEMLGTVYGNGRWGCYTTGDMLCNVLGLSIVPTSTGWKNSSGPKKGLELLALKDESLDHAESRLLEYFNDETCRVNKTYWPQGFHPGVLESLFCDFAGLVKGSYYSGRNLDRMMDRMAKVCNSWEWDVGVLNNILRARKEAFPNDQLGELNGWTFIDKQRKQVFKNERKVLCGSSNRTSTCTTGAMKWTAVLEAISSG